MTKGQERSVQETLTGCAAVQAQVYSSDCLGNRLLLLLAPFVWSLSRLLGSSQGDIAVSWVINSSERGCNQQEQLVGRGKCAEVQGHQMLAERCVNGRGTLISLPAPQSEEVGHFEVGLSPTLPPEVGGRELPGGSLPCFPPFSALQL